MEKQSGNGVLEEFRIEFWECWQRLPNKGFFLTLLVAWVALFHFVGNSTLGYAKTSSLPVWTYYSLTAGGKGILDSDEGYGVLMPVVVLALFWWKRKQLLSLDLREWWPGLVLMAGALAIHLLGFLVQQPKISIIAFFVGLYGMTGLAWGWRWMYASFFPFFLFCFCLPLGEQAERISFPLRLLVSDLVVMFCHYVLAVDIIQQGNILIDPTGSYKYEVAAACSGIRSLTATLAMSIVLGFVSLQKPWKRIVLIASSVPLAVLGNLVRMLSIVIAAEIGGQEMGNYVHEGGPAGLFSLLPYGLGFVGLLILEGYLREPTPKPKPPAASPQAQTMEVKAT
jgi:exosortase